MKQLDARLKWRDPLVCSTCGDAVLQIKRARGDLLVQAKLSDFASLCVRFDFNVPVDAPCLSDESFDDVICSSFVLSYPGKTFRTPALRPKSTKLSTQGVYSEVLAGAAFPSNSYSCFCCTFEICQPATHVAISRGSERGYVLHVIMSMLVVRAPWHCWLLTTEVVGCKWL